ncbi:MAG: STM3941 family protein, partial [Lactococcus cremoris]
MFDNQSQELDDDKKTEIIESTDVSNFKARLWTGLIILAILLVGIFGYFQKKVKTQSTFMVNKNYLVIDDDTNT